MINRIIIMLPLLTETTKTTSPSVWPFSLFSPCSITFFLYFTSLAFLRPLHTHSHTFLPLLLCPANPLFDSSAQNVNLISSFQIKATFHFKIGVTGRSLNSHCEGILAEPQLTKSTFKVFMAGDNWQDHLKLDDWQYFTVTWKNITRGFSFYTTAVN